MKNLLPELLEYLYPYIDYNVARESKRDMLKNYIS